MLETLIKQYFLENYTILEIRELLSKNNGISKSISTIKRILKSLGLKRKNFQESDMKEIISAIIEEVHSSGYNLGYRSLWKKLKMQYNLKVKRDTVYEILKIVDPVGVADRFGNKLQRRQYLSPGPNFIWHLDRYDKLKQFGFAIHGCIDGFSRKVLWLEVATTNNDPAVTAHYFLKTVKELKFLPTIIRCDKGTGNSLIGLLQTCLRSKHNDKLAGNGSYIEGKSVHNQRIESYWGRMRQHTVDFYIQLFKSMQSKNLFNGSSFHIKSLQFCFGPILKHDLYYNKNLWNEHRIRKQPARNLIAGRPNALFNLPHQYNRRDYKKIVDENTVQKLMDELTVKPQLFDPLIKELAELLIPDMKTPVNVTEALAMYKKMMKVHAARINNQ